jgi:hypothetical protein
MTDKEMMALFNASTPLKVRFAYPVLGLLAFFFPGFVGIAFLKATSDALQKLSFEERCALVKVLKLEY